MIKFNRYVNRATSGVLPGFILLVFFQSVVIASTDSPTGGWPTSTPEKQGLSSETLYEMVAFIRENNYKIDNLIIVRNGYLVLDANFYPFHCEQKHNLFSCTKSVMSALIGIAVGQGHIQSVMQPVTDFFEGQQIANLDDRKRSMTLENLLTMTSGLQCRDTGAYQWKGLSEMRNSADWPQHVLDLPMAGPPGEKFDYCNGNALLLSAIIQNTTRMKTLEFARQYLFDPLGIVDVDWKSSPNGVALGYAGMWLRPHDIAKFGQLYLNEGRWGNQQIVPSKWVAASTEGHVETPAVQYGYNWWVAKTGGRFLFWKGDSVRTYEAVGSNGQRISVIPEKKMVVVITGSLRDSRRPFDTRKLIARYIIPAASAGEIPADEKAQARLAELLESAARPIAYNWKSKAEGSAKEGVYTHNASPEFQFEYPETSHKARTNSDRQIMRMQYDVDEFSAAVVDASERIKIEDLGPAYYTRNEFPVDASDLKVIANKAITLRCGTSAYKTTIEWLWKESLPITTYLVSTCKDGKYIFLAAHAWKHHKKLEPVVQSLAFSDTR